MSEDKQADREEYVEYRVRIPKPIYAKLHHLKAHYKYTGKYNVSTINDIILMAISEFLKRHKKDLTSSADS